MKLHVHQSSGAARLLAKLTHQTSGMFCMLTVVRLNASPTALTRSSRLMVLLAISFHSLAWIRRGKERLCKWGMQVGTVL